MRMLRDARTMGLSAFVSLGMAAARSILVLRLLGPEPSGIWKTVMVLYMCGEFLRLGVTKGLALRVPVFQGKGEPEEAASDIRAAGAYTVLTGLLFAAVLWAASFFVADARYATAVRFMAVVMLLAQPHQWLREAAGAQQRFTTRGKELLLTGVIDFAAGISLSYLFGLEGIAMATVLTILIPLGYLWRETDWGGALRLDFPRTRALMAAGIPLSLADSAFGLLRFVDLLVLSSLLGATAAGHYQVSLLVTEFSISIGNFAVAQVIGAHLLTEFGRTGSLRAAARYIERPLELFSLALPPVLAVGTVLVGPTVERLLPQYAAGIGAAQVTIWATLFVFFHLSLGSFFQAARQYRTVLALLAAILPSAALAHYLVVSHGHGLTAVAWTSLLLLAGTVAAELFIARRACQAGHWTAVRWIGQLYAPVLTFIGLTSFMEANRWQLIWRLAAIAALAAAWVGPRLLAPAPLWRTQQEESAA